MRFDVIMMSRPDEAFAYKESSLKQSSINLLLSYEMMKSFFDTCNKRVTAISKKGPRFLRHLVHW